MEILFLILKIIGSCLLVLIGICLLLILSILFIPVRYRMKGKGEVPKTLETDVVFSWFLHMFHGRIHYSTDGFQFKIRIFGIPLKLRKQIYIKEIQIIEEDTADEVTDVNESVKESDEVETSKESEIEAPKEVSKVTTDSSNKEVTRKGFFKKLSFKGIIEKCKQFWQKLIQFKNQLGNIKNIILEETNKNAAKTLFREFKHLMKHYAPRKASGEIQFGTENPADTGQILGVISLFPFWYRNKISVIPDFTADELYAKGNISLKGHIRSIHLFTSGIRLITNKDIRKLINQIRT